MRRTKIVATAGPAWDAHGVLDAMIAAGVDVVRLNASHADKHELERRLGEVRSAAAKAGRYVAVMVDLPGPKVRTGEIPEGTVLLPGSRVTLGAEGAATVIPITYSGLAADVGPGDRILLDDGAIELRVTDVDGDTVAAEVLTGGTLRSHKGVNVPGVALSVDAVTAVDLDVAAWAAAAGVDYLAQSFVRCADDVTRLREVAGEVPIVAKIEKYEALQALAGIVEAADAIMVARGDLGVETSPEEVPVAQHRIVSVCRRARRPVIVATQMLESMVASPRPTRAEASDVATAVFELADAVMLSAESATGQHPVESVETMDRIARIAEDHLVETGELGPAASGAEGGVTLAVSAAACDLAADLAVAAIVPATESGATARAVASHRPAVPVIAVTPHEEVARRLALVWGVTPLVVDHSHDAEQAARAAMVMVREVGVPLDGDRVVLTAGVASTRQGATDMVRVLEI